MAMDASWRTVLKKLDFSHEERGAIIQQLYSSKISIQSLFDDCMATGGEEALTSALKGFFHKPAGTHLQKKVRIFSLRAYDEELVLKGSWLTLNPCSFNPLILSKGFLVIFKGGELDKEAPGICSFEEVVDGETYFLQDIGSMHDKVKALQNFNQSEMRASEEEFSQSMVTELKAHGFATDPVVSTELRLHCAGTKDEQEFDAVILDEGSKAFIGSAKHSAHGTAVVDQVLAQVQTVLQRSNDERYPSYAPFRGRQLGCCLCVDYIDPKRRHPIERMCYRKGVGLFQRSGAALTMRMLPFVEQQVINPGFINMVIRGFTKLAR